MKLVLPEVPHSKHYLVWHLASCGVVFADDAVLAGEPGRSAEYKAPFMPAVERDGNGFPRHVRFDLIADFQRGTSSSWAKSASDPKTHPSVRAAFSPEHWLQLKDTGAN